MATCNHWSHVPRSAAQHMCWAAPHDTPHDMPLILQHQSRSVRAGQGGPHATHVAAVNKPHRRESSVSPRKREPCPACPPVNGPRQTPKRLRPPHFQPQEGRPPQRFPHAVLQQGLVFRNQVQQLALPRDAPTQKVAQTSLPFLLRGGSVVPCGAGVFCGCFPGTMADRTPPL